MTDVGSGDGVEVVPGVVGGVGVTTTGDGAVPTTVAVPADDGP